MAIKVARAQAQGDPGLLSFLGKFTRAATGTIGGLGIPGISTAARVINRVAGGGRAVQVNRVANIVAPPPPGAFQVPNNASRALQQVGLRGGATETIRGIQLPGVTIGSRTRSIGGQFASTNLPMVQQNGTAVTTCPPQGFKLNKSDYFLRSGEFVPAGTRFVRRRKRNPGNSRANSRAIARIASAKSMAKQLSRISIRPACATRHVSRKKSS